MKNKKLILQGILVIVVMVLLVVGMINFVPYIWTGHTVPWVKKVSSFFGLESFALSLIIANILDCLIIPFAVLIIWFAVKLVKKIKKSEDK